MPSDENISSLGYVSLIPGLSNTLLHLTRKEQQKESNKRRTSREEQHKESNKRRTSREEQHKESNKRRISREEQQK